MELVDTHAHINFSAFDDDREEVIKRMGAEGVKAIINVGTDLKASEDSVKLAQKYDFIYATVGIHPTDSRELDIEKSTEKLAILAKNPKIVGIGECGLDFYREEDRSERKRQIELFESQIQVAQSRKLPIVVHSREAWEDTLKIIKKTDQKNGVFHSWTYPPEITREAIEETGFYFAFNGIVTFKNAGILLDSVKMVPLDRLLLETDCPFLAPAPNRGLRNEPMNVKLIATTIAQVKDTTVEKIAQTTTTNAKITFNI